MKKKQKKTDQNNHNRHITTWKLKRKSKNVGHVSCIIGCYPRNGYVGDTESTLDVTYKPNWCDNNISGGRFADIWHDPPQCRVGLEFNLNILSSRLYWLKMQHSWLRSVKRVRFPQGLSFVLYLYFRTFYFCVVELWVLVNLKYRNKQKKKTCKPSLLC